MTDEIELNYWMVGTRTEVISSVSIGVGRELIRKLKTQIKEDAELKDEIDVWKVTPFLKLTETDQLLDRPLDIPHACLPNQKVKLVFADQLPHDHVHLIVRSQVYEVNCYVHGGSSVTIRIPCRENVYDLKEAIKSKMINTLEHVEAGRLSLWKIFVPVGEEGKHGDLGDGDELQDYELWKVFPYPNDLRPGNRHIFVRIPGLGQKRKADSSLEDFVHSVKKSKPAIHSPSTLAKKNVYENIQRSSKDRILDDRPDEDKLIPPVSLLYDGFGQFLDIAAGGTDVEGLSDVNALELQLAVDAFARSMTGFFENEDKRRDEGLRRLNEIFAVRKDGNIPTFAAASVGSVRTDGHFTGPHGILTLITEFKNWSTGNAGQPEVELVGYFAHSFCQEVEHRSADSESLSGWTVPGLGITIVGPDVRFYGMLTLGTKYRLVTLTAALSCISSASEGSERRALYRAFTAASVLQARICQDALHSRFLKENSIYNPSVSQLRRWPDAGDNYLTFQIQDRFAESQQDRFLYLAKTRETEGGQTIIIKFGRQYCPELHGICAKSGHAPALLAYERLPGNWYGVAMEYVADAVPITKHKSISKYRKRWEADLQKLVMEFHGHGFVHGDLRDANILSRADGSVVLVDFDWGGKDGEVWYPTPKLNQELLDGRSNKGLEITKEDDLRVVNRTFKRVARVAELSLNS